MREVQFKLCGAILALLVCCFSHKSASADEKVIQQEKLSYDKCLKVIKTSENKLSVTPKIIDSINQRREAIFELVDGTLTITCDGEKEL